MDDDLQCPKCGENAIIVSDNPSSLPWADDDDRDIECEHCKAELTVVCYVTKIEWKFVDENREDIKFED